MHENEPSLVLAGQGSNGEVAHGSGDDRGDLLITETMLLDAMTNDRSFHAGEYRSIVVRRQCTFLEEARKHRFSWAFSFVDLSALSGYKDLGSAVLRASYLVAPGALPELDDDPASQQLPLVLNSDSDCAFRKRSLADLAQRKIGGNVIEAASMRAVIETVEQCKGIALLPTFLIAQRGLCPVNGETLELRYRIYHTA